MINKLRKRMIWISVTSLVTVFLIIFTCIYAISVRQLNVTMDILTDRISEDGGVFRPFDKRHPRPPAMEKFPGFFTEETPFSTRFFVVHFDVNGNIMGENMDSVSSVTQETVYKYARSAFEKGKKRGWESSYRYKLKGVAGGSTIVFVDGSVNRSVTRTILITAGIVLLASAVVILFLIILLSKRAVRPMAESYERQKQFVTDANHELKTPLTLILTNLEILESEVGANEWLDDIRAEGLRMSGLVGQLTALSRLDEEQPKLLCTDFSLTEAANDTAAEFQALADSRGLTLHTRIQPDVFCTGDEGALRRVMAILLDNAVKYCDPQGEIVLSLAEKRGLIICVENTFRNVNTLEMNRLFDRFYRADKARTAESSFGIGLSLAKAIVRQHHGEMSVYKVGTDKIGFRVTLKSKAHY